MEQLSDQTGEESIVITASVKEGTLSHLGSGMGKGFFDEGRDEIKSQFLGYCLNSKFRLTKFVCVKLQIFSYPSVLNMFWVLKRTVSLRWFF